MTTTVATLIADHIGGTARVITSSGRRWLRSSGPRDSPADSRPGCILYIAAYVENSLFCR
jgi:hypothetical protein